MAVQPIYMTDGRVMTARLLKEKIYGTNGTEAFPANGKVGVLHTTSDDGISILAGIQLEAAFHNKTADFIYKPFSAAEIGNLNTAINELIDAGVSAIIIASNQAPMKAAVTALHDADSLVPVFTSYVNSNADSVDATITYKFDMYANAWLDIVDPNGELGLSASYWTFYNDMIAANFAENATNAYAMAGYIAAHIFIAGIERVGENFLSWETFIAAMEDGAISVPMGGTVDFSGGKRWGIDSMALLKLSQAGPTPAWNKVRDIETLTEIQGK
jgi:ABC-type branched-subunit amino acid transport system substrate-binding protein